MLLAKDGKKAAKADWNPKTKHTPANVPQSDLYPPMITAAKTFNDKVNDKTGSTAFDGVTDQPEEA